MGTLFALLDHEWSRLAIASDVRRATNEILALADNCTDWHEAQAWMQSPEVHPEEKNRVLVALAYRASVGGDQVAARIVLALLMPGLVVEVGRHRIRPSAQRISLAEVEAIVVEGAWRVIRCYPTHRPGNVAANILLDLRKWLCEPSTSVREELVDDTENRSDRAETDDEPVIDHRANDVSMIVAHAVGAKRLDRRDADLILDTTVRGITCLDAAAGRSMTERTFRRRQRAAEDRLARHARKVFAA